MNTVGVFFVSPSMPCTDEDEEGEGDERHEDGEDHKSGGLSTGAKAGIDAGVGAGVLLATILVA